MLSSTSPVAVVSNGRLSLIRPQRNDTLMQSMEDLVEILDSPPAQLGYIIIEHDRDVALRVVEGVTMMHNGLILEEGRLDDIENDPEVLKLYLGGTHA